MKTLINVMAKASSIMSRFIKNEVKFVIIITALILLGCENIINTEDDINIQDNTNAQKVVMKEVFNELREFLIIIQNDELTVRLPEFERRAFSKHNNLNGLESFFIDQELNEIWKSDDLYIILRLPLVFEIKQINVQGIFELVQAVTLEKWEELYGY